MNRQLVRETLQKQIQNMSNELQELRLSSHVLSGQKSWKVSSQLTEKRERELRQSVEECQRILKYTF